MKVVVDGRFRWSITAERHFPAQAIVGYASTQDVKLKPGIQDAKGGAEHYLRGGVAMQCDGEGGEAGDGGPQVGRDSGVAHRVVVVTVGADMFSG